MGVACVVRHLVRAANDIGAVGCTALAEALREAEVAEREAETEAVAVVRDD